MIPILVILFGTLLLVYGVERARGRGSGAFSRAGRIALATMFLFTGVSHFILTAGMAEMVPPPFPPTLTVYITGVLEILGALGLLWKSTSRLAAWALLLFLVAVLPANVYAAMNYTGLGGHADGPGYLYQRVPLQLLMMAWTWYFGVRRNPVREAGGEKQQRATSS